MKVLHFVLLIAFIDQSFQKLPEQYKEVEDGLDQNFESKSAKHRVTGEISKEKCQEYKNLVSRSYRAPVPCLFKKCKPRIIKEYICNDFAGLIFGGNVTSPKEFPHMAAIGWKGNDGRPSFRCGGSLISDQFVLTVAHCAEQANLKPYIVRLGEQNLARDDDQAQPVDYSIKRIIKPKGFHYGIKEHDVALIELEQTVTFNEFIRPACLHQEAIFTEDVIATGWGKTTRNSEGSDDLMKVSLKIVDSESCFENLKDDIGASKIFETQICAGGIRDKDTCNGDSGGPIQVSHSDAKCVYDVIGLTSYGPLACGTILPSIFTRVSPYIDWIERIVWP